MAPSPATPLHNPRRDIPDQRPDREVGLAELRDDRAALKTVRAAAEDLRLLRHSRSEARLSRGLKADLVAFVYGMINLAQPFGAARLLSPAGSPVSLSNTQNDSICGRNSGRGRTNVSRIGSPS